MTTALTPTRLTAVVFAGIAYFVVAVVILAVLNPQMSPLARPMSDYLGGRQPLFAATTFLALAIAVSALTLALHAALQRGALARLGLTLFWIAVVGIVIAGAFPDMPMHGVGSLMTVPSLTVGAIVLSWAPGRAAGWDTLRARLLILALTMCAILVGRATVLSGYGLGGLAQRAYFAAFFTWMTLVAWRIMTDAGVANRVNVTVP